MRTVTQVIGANMRQLRERRAKVLHDVATSARELGLTWDASAVSRIETGKRDLSLEEFLALPLVMSVALNEVVSLVDLLEMDPEQRIFIKSFDQETFVLPLFAMLAEPWLAFVKLTHRDTAGETIQAHLQEKMTKVHTARAPDEDPSTLRETYEIAGELGVKPGEVTAACQALWGENTFLLSWEREKRLSNSGADLSSPTTVRTLRGHISRQLRAELRDYFATRKQSDNPIGDE